MTALRLASMLFLFALAGCTTAGVPTDPLFANQKPAVTKAVTGDPVAVPFTEPPRPVNPYGGE